MVVLRFLFLVVLLNVIRYAAGGLIEWWTVMPPLFSAMEAEFGVFNTAFTTFDWATSFLYNFLMWLSAAWIFHLARPALRGSDLVASLKAFGLGWLFFASVSAIYMNHYAHPKDFYAWNVLDGVIAFGVVAVANGLLYRRVMGRHAAMPAAASTTV